MFAKHLFLSVVVFALLEGTAAAKGAMVGHVYFSNEQIADQSPKALTKYFAKSEPKIEVKRNKEKAWEVIMVAFFAKASVPGPVTIWIYDKDDKAALKANEPITAISVDKSPTKIFIHSLFIDPNLGFNKNRSYIVMVGQIIGKRNRVYARGQVDLKS